ncbi:unnamed protein product [Allacma fusca]|uniref:Uncharacterized protein n=1 Tax=Allacma fusca TaxID=39272 RepID=A0A8J2LJ20_9HEXA|nr:unnamed protein product [Allacma fusca]
MVPRVILLLWLVLATSFAAPDKAPTSGGGGISSGYDQQSAPANQGYKPSVFLSNAEVKNPAPSPNYGVVQGSSPGAGSYSFEYPAGNNLNQGKELYSNNFGPSSFSNAAGGYAQAPSDTSYGPPAVGGGGGGGAHGGNYQGEGPSYTYHYQHYPSPSRPHVSPGDEGSIFDGLGDVGLPALGGLGGVGGLLAIGKGLLALKPLLLLGLLLLLGIPLLLLFLPIPIITVSNLPGLSSGTEPTSRVRQYGQSMLSSYISQISDRVLNSEECLERLICKMPQVPGKFQGKAKILWEQYGKKFFSSHRVQRALNAYFDEVSGRSRISKCNQKFKCSNKFL